MAIKEMNKFTQSSQTQRNTLTRAFSLLILVFLWFFIIIYLPNRSSFILIQNSEFPATNCSTAIFVYDLPTKFNLDLLDNCKSLNIYTDMCPHVANNGLGQPLRHLEPNWFATHQFIAELIVHARIENHPCRTSNSTEATLFYVPFYGGLYASSQFREKNFTHRDSLAIELLDYLQEQSSWKRNKGGDHFFFFGRTAWDFMRSDDAQDFGANSLLIHPLVKEMTIFTVERHPWHGKNQIGVPYPSYFHPFKLDELMTWMDRMRRHQRPYLFSFAGAPRTGVEKAKIRTEIIKQCAESIRCNLLKCENGASRCHEPREVLRVMTESEFCLQAPGDSFTRRSVFDSVLAGCVPVFFSPHTAYTQYEWYFPSDPSEYSVFISEEKTSQIESELSRISSARIARMRRTVIDLIPRLTYAHPNSTDKGFRDAVDVALDRLSTKVRSKI